MDWKPPNAWVLRPSGGAADVHNAQHPINGYQTLDLTNWDPTAGDPVPAAGLIVRQNINGIQHFIQSQRLLYGTGIIPVLNNIRQLNGMTAQYINQFGREQIIYNVSPVSQNPQPTGPYVLIQFASAGVTGGFAASSPSGSAMSYAVDPVNGTECPLTVAIGALPQGAKIVYSNLNLNITPHTTWYAYLPPDATLQITDTDLGVVGSVSTLDKADELAYLESVTPLPMTVSLDLGYHSELYYADGVAFNYTTEAAAAARAVQLNNGGVGSVGAAGGYTVPIFPAPPPWEGHDLVILWVPYGVAGGTFYDATFDATFVIQLPAVTGPTTQPAFSINTTGYPWSANISVFDSKSISVDPTNPSFPLKWTKGSPPPGPDGNPWAPYGTHITDVTKAAIFSIFYEDTGGTAVKTAYPFVVTSQPHLGPDVPVVPIGTTISPLNYANQIIQVWPTFLSGLDVFGDLPNDWYVNYYTDVPYGRVFQPPDSWGWSTNLLTVGPLALLTSSDVNY